MRFPRRLTASAVVSTMLAAGLAGCTSDDDTAGDVTEVVIGADLASGSAVDTAYARALQLRIEQINASGTLGDRQLVLRVQDNRSDPTASLRNISTFADDPSVAAIVTGVCGECVVGAVKKINEKKLPTIALAASDEVTNPVAERRFVFKLGPNSQDSNAAMVAELIRTKTKRVGILYADDDYGNGGTAALVEQLTKAGIEVSGKSRVKPTATEITQAVGTLADAEPDALIFLVGSDQASAAAIGAKAAGFKGRVYFDAAAAGDMFIPQEAAAATEQGDDGVHPDPGDRRRHRDHPGEGLPQAVVPGLHLPVRQLLRRGGVRRRRGRPDRRRGGQGRRGPDPDAGRAGDLADRRAVRPDPADPGQPLRPDAPGADPAGGPQRPLAPAELQR